MRWALSLAMLGLAACGDGAPTTDAALLDSARPDAASDDADSSDTSDADVGDAHAPDSGRFLEPGLHLDVGFPVGDDERNAHVYVPSSLPAALVVLLHGNGGSADAMIGEGVRTAPFSEWLSVAEEESLTLLIPDGRPAPGETAQGWNDCRGDAVGNPESDDVRHLAAMVDQLVGGGRGRTDMVFVTGHSNGGHMTLRLALERPDLARAIAVVAASLPSDATTECTDTGAPMPLLVLNGEEDPILPFAGGAMPRGRGQVVGFEELVARWVMRNGIDGAPTERLFDRSIAGERIDTRIEVTDYASADGLPISAMRVVLGGHGEPSIAHEYPTTFESIVGKQSHDAEMARLIWTFFESLL